MANLICVIDLGGTTIKCSVVDDSGAEKRLRFKLEDFQSPRQFFEELLAEKARLKEARWAVGLPGSLENGKYLRETPNLPDAWSGGSVATALRSCGLDFKLENDANLAALGEAVYGAGEKFEEMVCVTLGTGVGSGIILNDRIHRGASGAAGELGHLLVEPGGRLCGCGGQGCLEAYGSASAIEERYLELTGEDFTAKKICENYSDDPQARKVVDEAARYLGVGLAQVINLLEPGAIVFAGGLSADLGLLLPVLRKARDKHLFAQRTSSTPMVRSQLDEPALFGGRALIQS